MKVAVVTLTNVYNYGNELQNYAVTRVLEQLGDIDHTTLVIKDHEGYLKQAARYLIYLGHYISRYRFTKREKYWRYEYRRRILFSRFHKRYIPSKTIKEIKDVPKMDHYILGSDQVWNPRWYDRQGMRKNLFLLTFALPKQRVCFSPSFGISSLDDGWKPWFREHLRDFPAISVREEAGAMIVKELIGKDAVVLIDPTLMLDKKEWRKISRAPKSINCSKKYILTYFLGEQTEEIKSDIRYYAQMLDAEVYALSDREQSILYMADPCAFIYLIDHAEMILTDSFHGSVFSFIFGRPFFVYARESTADNMISRIDTFIDRFDLRRKFLRSGERRSIDETLESDYSVGYRRLSKEREKVRTYLIKQLSLGDYKEDP